MEKQTTYFRRTTAQQRKLLFETWQSTGNVAKACRRARVSRQTFYNWKQRFETLGYTGLEKVKSHAPKHPRRTPAPIRQQIILMRQQNPKWGKRRIADQMAKTNDWQPLVSPNTVRQILIDAGLWQRIVEAKKNSNPASVPQRSRGKPQMLTSVSFQ